MGNCCAPNQEKDGLSGMKKIDEVELEKKDLDLFKQADETKGTIDFRTLYTTAPIIKFAEVKITEWLPQNQEVTQFSKCQWVNEAELNCEICQYTFEEAKKLMDEPDPLAYSYWKGIEVRDHLDYGELTIMKYSKNDTENKGICAGCFFRNSDLKRIFEGQ